MTIAVDCIPTTHPTFSFPGPLWRRASLQGAAPMHLKLGHQTVPPCHRIAQCPAPSISHLPHRQGVQCCLAPTRRALNPHHPHIRRHRQHLRPDRSTSRSPCIQLGPTPCSTRRRALVFSPRRQKTPKTVDHHPPGVRCQPTAGHPLHPRPSSALFSRRPLLRAPPTPPEGGR